MFPLASLSSVRTNFSRAECVIASDVRLMTKSALCTISEQCVLKERKRLDVVVVGCARAVGENIKQAAPPTRKKLAQANKKRRERAEKMPTHQHQRRCE